MSRDPGLRNFIVDCLHFRIEDILTTTSAVQTDLLPITTRQASWLALKYGSAAVVTSMSPKTLVSNWSRSRLLLIFPLEYVCSGGKMEDINGGRHTLLLPKYQAGQILEIYGIYNLFWKGVEHCIPALFTRMSIPPQNSAMALTLVFITSSPAVTSKMATLNRSRSSGLT